MRLRVLLAAGAVVVVGGAVATPVLIAHARAMDGHPAASTGEANVMLAMQPAVGAASLLTPSGVPVPGTTESAHGTPTATGAGSPAASSARPSASPSPSHTAKPKPKPSPKPTSHPSPPAGSSVVDQLLAQINGLRAQHGLPPYALLAGLGASAHAHNLQMMGGCGLSHQCPGEPSLGDRITAQGVHWTSCGENIGWSGPHPNTTSAIVAAAEGLTTSMYNEQPPNDGHRQNLLSSSFHHIGIDVQRDSSGIVWLTQDFSS
jgi:uncharacterized protein YkwD